MLQVILLLIKNEVIMNVNYGSGISWGQKIMNVMRNIFLFCILAVSNMMAVTSYSQSVRFDIDVKNTTLAAVFDEIEKNSEFSIIYLSKDIDLKEIVSAKARHQTVDVILNKVLEKQGLLYEIKDKHIIIYKQASLAIVDAIRQQTGKRISGMVIDDQGEPITGANIMEKGTTNGIVTDINGNFTLNVSEYAVLQVSYIGYITQEIAVMNQNEFNIVFREDNLMLEEVVVVGYGMQKKVNLTGSVSTVDMPSVLGNRPVSSTAQVLEGIVPGLQISRDNGKPGVGVNINIRGVTSINNTETSPLVLVDNVPMDLSMVDPNDIESISVLKDVAASAVYGARAAFGIILVKTKRAEKDTPIRVNYSNNFSFSRPAILPVKIGPYETVKVLSDLNMDSYIGGQTIHVWLGLMDDYYNKGLYPEGYTYNNNTRYNLSETDVYADMMDKFGFQQQHNISLSGGSSRTTYRASLGVVDEDGILHNNKDKYTRYNATAFMSMEATKWLTGEVDVRYSDSKTLTAQGASEGGSLWSRAAGYQPMGRLGSDVTFTGELLPYNTPRNLIDLDDPKRNRNNDTRILGRAIITPLRGLEIIGEYSFNRAWNSESLAELFYYVNNSIQGAKVSSRARSNYYMFQSFSTRNAINIYATYKKSFTEAHNLTFMTGYNQEAFYGESLRGENYDLIDQKLPSLSLSNGSPLTSDGFWEYAVRGVFYRLNYDYKGRYLFETNGRYDGSSRFNKKGRFGFFPSISAGWRISEESFLQSEKGFLSNLKVRISLGSIGNQNVGYYGHMSIMSPYTQSSPNKSNWILPGQLDYVTSMAAPSVISPNYTWETVQTLDWGVDFGLLKNQLTGTFDWFQRDTKNMLAPAEPAPASFGSNYPNTNAADLRTRGWELSLQWNSKVNKVGYNVGFNLYDNYSIITRYENPTGLLLNGSSLYFRQGLRYGEIWGYTTDRFYTDDDFDSDGQLKAGIPYVRGYNNPNPGDILYKDNGDGIIDNGANRFENPGDMSIIGNNTARYQFGINGGISWKNFDFTFFFNGVGKRDLVMPGYWAPNGTFTASVFNYQTDYWTKDNLNAYWPRIYGAVVSGVDDNNSANQRTQTRYLQDASYIRLKNITIGYSLDQDINKRLHIQALRFFVSGENLYTWHHLPTGYYPDTYVALPGSLNMNGSIQGDSGAGNWSYPLMRQFSIGLNFIF
jgi:TonB-linked SusC/RagA family outer membrane protein